jgi:hypothetical protein
MKELSIPQSMQRNPAKDEVVKILKPFKSKIVYFERCYGRSPEMVEILHVDDHRLDFLVAKIIEELYEGTCTKDRYLFTAVLLKESIELDLLRRLREAYAELKSLYALEWNEPKKEGFLAKLWRLFKWR